MNLTSSEIARLIQSDAHRYFHRRFRQLKSTWKPPYGPFGCSVDDYIDRVQSTLKNSKIFLKRSVKEIYINNYSPMILNMHRANMDIRYVVDPYACCVYVVDYINKDKTIKVHFYSSLYIILCLITMKPNWTDHTFRPS